MREQALCINSELLRLSFVEILEVRTATLSYNIFTIYMRYWSAEFQAYTSSTIFPEYFNIFMQSGFWEEAWAKWSTKTSEILSAHVCLH